MTTIQDLPVTIILQYPHNHRLKKTVKYQAITNYNTINLNKKEIFLQKDYTEVSFGLQMTDQQHKVHLYEQIILSIFSPLSMELHTPLVEQETWKEPKLYTPQL